VRDETDRKYLRILLSGLVRVPLQGGIWIFFLLLKSHVWKVHYVTRVFLSIIFLRGWRCMGHWDIL